MTPLEMIAEWRKGCSCAPAGKPEACQECALALINAIENKFLDKDARHELIPMQNDEGKRGWFFDCDEFYIDIDLEEDGAHTVYFRNRKEDTDELYVPYVAPSVVSQTPVEPSLRVIQFIENLDKRLEAEGYATECRRAVVAAMLDIGGTAALDDPITCRYPLCKSEDEQRIIAAEVYAELYGAPAPEGTTRTAPT